MYFALLRRRLLAALCLACVASVALAQDPNVIAAQAAARQWLAFVDRGDAQASWGAAGWILVALASIVLIAVLWAANRVRLVAVQRESGSETSALPDGVRPRLAGPVLMASVQARVGIVVGVVLLMTFKPDLPSSLVIVAAAFVLGLASAVPAWTRRPERRTAGGSL